MYIHNLQFITYLSLVSDPIFNLTKLVPGKIKEYDDFFPKIVA